MELPTWGTRGTNEHQQLTLRTTPDGEPAMRIPRSDDPEDQPQAGTSTSAIANIYRGALGLFEKSNPNKGIARFGLPFLQSIKHYVFSDPFTTLLDAPAHRFIVVFFSLYMTIYLAFSWIYMLFPSSCMAEPTRSFGHSFWFSFQTASTIGYSSGMYPDPDCNFFNFVAMIEIIGASLLDYCLMGVVFARFAAPLPKAQAIRFSSNAVLYQGQDSDPKAARHWQLSFRMASIRKHNLLKPEITLLLAVPEGGAEDPSSAALCFMELEVHDLVSQIANLRLGLPVIIVHSVTPSSPLFRLSLETMEARGLEVICFLDGMDPMTSNSVQARHSYRASEIRMDETFAPIGLQSNWRGQMGLDFSEFDKTVALNYPRVSDSGHGELTHINSGHLAGPMPEIQPAMGTDGDRPNVFSEHERHLRSRRLGSLGNIADGEHGAAAAAAAAAARQAGANAFQGSWANGDVGQAGANPFPGAGAGPSGSASASASAGGSPLKGAPGSADGAVGRQYGQRVAALIEAVLHDPALSADVKRAAALAKAELTLAMTVAGSPRLAAVPEAWKQPLVQQQQQQGQQGQQQGQGQVHGQQQGQAEPWQPALQQASYVQVQQPLPYGNPRQQDGEHYGNHQPAQQQQQQQQQHLAGTAYPLPPSSFSVGGAGNATQYSLE